uniref:Scavenger receptor class B member 1 n=2 Tax=Ixodes scapularis TaxID=6945 RepID=A0A1S4L9Z8_IXOSC
MNCIKERISLCVISLLSVVLGMLTLLGFDNIFRLILNKVIRRISLCVISLLSVVLGMLTLLGFDNIFRLILNKEVSLAEHSRAFPMWRDVGHDTLVRFYFFNTTAQLLKEQNFIIRGIASLTLSGLGQRIFISRTVGQLTFGGYPDILILLGSVVDSGRPRPGQPGFNIQDVFRNGYRAVTKVLGSLVDPNQQGTNGKFGYMINKNDTVDGEYTIFTGENDISQVNKVYEFNKQRSIPTENMGYEDFMGLKVKRFVAGPLAFDSGQKFRENSCFAAGKELPEGGTDLGPCKQGAPLVLSFPHFLYADPAYLADVDGLHPDVTKHQFFFNSEPTLGVTVNVRGRIQYVEARGDTLKMLRTIVNLPEYVQWFSVGIIIVSSIALASTAFALFRPRTRRGDITKVRPINGASKAKYADTHCADILPNKVERIIQNGLERLPNTFGITAARNNFINELKSGNNNNPRRPSEPSAPPEVNIYK